MRLSRFCSHAELHAILREGAIHNTTDHFRKGKGGSISRGFCLTDDEPSTAWRYLSGIVTPHVCLIYEIPERHLTVSSGKYASHTYEQGIYRPKTIIKREYCTDTLRKEWIVAILPLETFVPQQDLEIVRYYHENKNQLKQQYAQQWK